MRYRPPVLPAPGCYCATINPCDFCTGLRALVTLEDADEACEAAEYLIRDGFDFNRDFRVYRETAIVAERPVTCAEVVEAIATFTEETRRA